MDQTSGQWRTLKRSALLFGAMFILVVAVLLRVEYLYYMSFALAATPAVAWVFARRGSANVEATRVMPGVAKAGERVPMRIELENIGPTRKQLLVLRDTLPSGLVADPSATTSKLNSHHPLAHSFEHLVQIEN